jgi:hypothetical protein
MLTYLVKTMVFGDGVTLTIDRLVLVLVSASRFWVLVLRDVGTLPAGLVPI